MPAPGSGVGRRDQGNLSLVPDGYAEMTPTVLVPFLAYVGAERLHGSGVLAVLALGLHLRTYGHAATTSQGWLLGRAVWSYADFLITSLVFAILGYELMKVIDRTEVSRDAVALAALVVITLVGLRAGWVFASVGYARRRSRHRDEPMPQGWRKSMVVSWAGMRGVVTVAAALALPEVVDSGQPFPDDDDALEVTELRQRAARAALAHLRQDRPSGVSEEVTQAATIQYEGYLAAQVAMAEARAHDDRDRTGQDRLTPVLEQASAIERSLVLEARRRGEVSPASADEVLRDIEGRALRDFR